MSLAHIAKSLNPEGVLAPQPSRNRKQRAWVTSFIHERCTTNVIAECRFGAARYRKAILNVAGN
jgi:hypothetical protein